MKHLRRFFLWAGLLGKRLLRRPAYLAVLLLIPLFAAALTLFARQASGAVTVALVGEEPLSPAAEAAIKRLSREDGILRCLVLDDETQAREAVRTGRADAAWIFHADLEAQLERFARRGRGDAVTVIEREDDVFLMLAREKLFAALYPEVSYAIFRDYLNAELELGESADEYLRAYYHGATVSERILRFETAEGRPAEKGSLLTAPLRGILALLLLLCGMASGMYCYREERGESFVWLSARARRWLPLLCHLTAMLPAAAAALAAMALAGVTVGAGRELLLMLLYLPAAALFCELLRCLCPREEQYGALIPILTAAMLVFCPVFLDLELLYPLRCLLPPFWFLRAAVGAASPLALLLYAALLLPLTALLSLLRQRRRGI